MQRSATALRGTNLRVLAEQRARELGYASVEALLEEAYATDRPWTAVAAELGVCRVDSISQWARKLGMLRGEGWFMERAHRAPESVHPPTKQAVLAAAIARAAARVPTPAAVRSLARCQDLDPADVVLRLTPEEEAEWAAYHCRAPYLEV
jgi:hypothetical protein